MLTTLKTFGNIYLAKIIIDHGLEIRADVIPLFGDAVFKRKDLMCGRRQWLKHTENPFPHRAGKGLP